MSEMFDYTLYVHTDMTEIRRLKAPEELTPDELADYAAQHGYGDMADVCDDVSELERVESADGKTVWGKPQAPTVSDSILRQRARIAGNIDSYRGKMTDDDLAKHMREEGFLGWTARTVREILECKRDVTLSEADTLSALLGVTIGNLLIDNRGAHTPGRIVHGILNADGTLTVRVC